MSLVEITEFVCLASRNSLRLEMFAKYNSRGNSTTSINFRFSQWKITGEFQTRQFKKSCMQNRVLD
jgi:hypothetical protein